MNKCLYDINVFNNWSKKADQFFDLRLKDKKDLFPYQLIFICLNLYFHLLLSKAEAWIICTF